MNEKVVEELALKLAEIEKDGCFITTIFRALDTDDKRNQMLDFINTCDKKLKKSDIYLKEMLINGEIQDKDIVLDYLK